MLLSLPVELVERIVRFALPAEVTSKTYWRRQRVLQAFCLTSSLLCDVAQPILEETVWVPTARSWRGGVVRLAKQPKRFRMLWIGERPWSGWGALAPVLPSCELLQDLRITGEAHVDLRCLEHLPNLRCLVLRKVFLASSDFTLRRIIELTVDGCYLPTGDAIIAPSSFPSLRHLALGEEPKAKPSYSEPSFLGPYYSQVSSCVTSGRYVPPSEELPCLFLHSASWQAFDGRLADCFTHTAYLKLWESKEAAQGRARYYDGPFGAGGARHYEQLFCALRRALHKVDAIALALLYLPTAFTTFQVPAVQEALDAFVADCAAGGIEVDYEDEELAEGEVAISRKFAVYAEEQRAKRKKEEEDDDEAGEEPA
ncbi:hypothetical protein JCM10213_000837 [Rhodosporidiobolus nylandii]